MVNAHDILRIMEPSAESSFVDACNNCSPIISIALIFEWDCKSANPCISNYSSTHLFQEFSFSDY